MFTKTKKEMVSALSLNLLDKYWKLNFKDGLYLLLILIKYKEWKKKNFKLEELLRDWFSLGKYTLILERSFLKHLNWI